MKLTEPVGGNYLHPEGVYDAECIDVADLGMRPTAYGPKRKVMIRFWCGEYSEQGEPLYAQTTFTASLFKTAGLRKFLDAWLGKVGSELDMEKLLRRGARIQIRHNQVGDRTYANIISIMPVVGHPQLPPLTGYVRMQDRDRDASGNGAAASNNDDDDLPF